MVSALLFSFYTSGVYLRRKNSSALFKTVAFKTCKINNFISREIFVNMIRCSESGPERSVWIHS
jgi:hypothetical protein